MRSLNWRPVSMNDSQTFIVDLEDVTAGVGSGIQPKKEIIQNQFAIDNYTSLKDQQMDDGSAVHIQQTSYDMIQESASFPDHQQKQQDRLCDPLYDPDLNHRESHSQEKMD